jgi:Mor family transcriptional regulator
MKQKIVWKEIVKDIACGMTDSDLSKKYNLSSRQLLSIFRQLSNLRERRIQMLTADIRSGMTHSELMGKYQLSTEGLASSLKFLVRANAIGQDELGPLSFFHNERKTVTESRKTPRNHPIPVVTICEVGKPGARYLVRDISEEGIGIAGIRAQIDEIKYLAVVGDEFGEIAPFEFEAQCRWAKHVEPEGGFCSGFRIKGISEQDLLRLREFIQGYTLGFDEA